MSTGLNGVTSTGDVVTWQGGREWQRVGTLDGRAQAFDAADGRWHAATETGIHESTDDGATWNAVITAPG